MKKYGLQPKVVIRNARIEDVNSVLLIEPEAFGKHHWSKEAFFAEFNNTYSRYYVCEDLITKEIIGYIGCWIIDNEGHITTLAVSSKYRRKHIADILLYNMIIDLQDQKVKWLTLEVRISNIAAINLYKKFNFKQLGIRKKYYQDNNEDALILWSEDINNESYINMLQDIINTQIIKKDLDADILQYSS